MKVQLETKDNNILNCIFQQNPTRITGIYIMTCNCVSFIVKRDHLKHNKTKTHIKYIENSKMDERKNIISY